MNFLVQFWDSITRMFTQFWESVLLAVGNYDLLLDTLDIALIAYIIYKGIQIVRETRAGQLVKGILLLLLLAYIFQYGAKLQQESDALQQETWECSVQPLQFLFPVVSWSFSLPRC